MNEDVQATPQGNQAGFIGMILSIIGICLCGIWLLSVPGLIVSLVGLRKEPRTMAIIGTILGGIGIFGFMFLGPLMLGILLPSLSTAREHARESVTRSKIQQVHAGSEKYHADNGRYPTSFHELTNLNHIPTDATKDAWDNPMQLEGGEDSPPEITSAGPDGVFDTDDDIHSRDD